MVPFLTFYVILGPFLRLFRTHTYKRNSTKSVNPPRTGRLGARMGTYLGRGTPSFAARLFRVGRCDRRWHSIVVDSGLRFSFGYMLSDKTAAGLIARAVRTYK